MNIACDSALVIGDIAGQLETLRELITQSPPADKIILVGDLNDRGPDSKGVIDFAMNHPDIIVIDSNHGHMMVDYYHGADLYGNYVFQGNGGGATLKSYGITWDGPSLEDIQNFIPKSHIEFLSTRPKYVLLNDNILITHAPLRPDLTLEEACEIGTWEQIDNSVLWNREPSIPRSEYKLQIYGHNSRWSEHKNSVHGLYGVCIDDCRHNQLMSLHIPSMKYTRVEYK